MAKSPEVTYRIGNCSASVFVNEVNGDGKPKRKFRSVSVQRSYKDGDEFKTTQYLRDNDLLRMQQLLTKADEWIEQDKGRGHSQQASRGR